MFTDSSIANKLTRMNMVVSGAALCLACGAFIAYDMHSIQKGMAENISTQAQVAGFNSITALLFDDAESAQKTLSGLSPVPSIVSAVLCKPNGQPLATFRRTANSPVPAAPLIPRGEMEDLRFDKEGLVLARAIVFQGKPAGIICIQADLSGLHARLRQYLLIAAIVLLTSLLAALLISPIFRRAIADPIIRLAEIALVVSRDKNYSVRAVPTASRDEMSVLIEAFNGMLSQIQIRDAALQQAHDELEQRVTERTQELAATNKELEAFAYSVSHDLRAPLRSIDGFSQAILEDYAERLDSTGQDHLRRVRHAAQRMSALIDDMLNLSKVTRSPIHREPLDLTVMARSIVEELRHDDPIRKVECQIEEGLSATGDFQLLRAALDNLIGNSWKYTSGHAAAKIEFGRVQGNGKSPFFVRDDGAGFDPRHSARLFGAFQRLHTEAEFPGTGIGLATVQRIIHRHGGEIWAEGAVEKGATFYFTL
jgi:signal transduction histidine kinase